MKTKIEEEDVLLVLRYFAYFRYPVTFDEIRTFLSVEITKKELHIMLNQLSERNIILNTKYLPAGRQGEILNTMLYTLRGHSIIYKKRLDGERQTEKILAKANQYFRLIFIFPQIKLIGLSGSLAMGHASQKDDVDLFIIAASNRLWTARFLALAVAQLSGLRRKRGVRHAAGKVCLNLFFDERELSIPEQKRNLYTAHEVIQMKPLFSERGTYEEFLKVNEWVYNFFPNAKNIPLDDRFVYLRGRARKLRASQVGTKRSSSLLGNILERFLKKLQLFLINRHHTTEIISDHQLWFFPRDFEQKLLRRGIIGKRKALG